MKSSKSKIKWKCNNARVLHTWNSWFKDSGLCMIGLRSKDIWYISKATVAPFEIQEDFIWILVLKLTNITQPNTLKSWMQFNQEKKKISSQFSSRNIRKPWIYCRKVSLLHICSMNGRILKNDSKIIHSSIKKIVKKCAKTKVKKWKSGTGTRELVERNGSCV